MKKKKITALTAMVLAMSMTALTITGCGSKDTSDTSTDTPAEAQTDENASAASESNEDAAPSGGEGSKGLICYSGTSLSYTFFVTEEMAAERAAKEYGYDFYSANAEFDALKENENFNTFMSMEPTAILCDPADTDGVTAAINTAVDSGVPVAVIDAVVAKDGHPGITITFDNYGAGFAAGEEVARLLKEKNGDYTGRVLNAYGIQNNEAIRLRREGFADAIKQYSGIELVEVPGEGNMDDTQNAALNAIAQYGSFDAMHAPSDSPCMGLYNALEQSDMLFKVGEEGHVILVTIDGEPIAIKRLKEGYYDATINQDAVAYAEIGMDMLVNYLIPGKEIPVGPYENDKYSWGSSEIVEDPDRGLLLTVPATVLTADNVDDPKLWGNVAATDFGLE